MYTFEDNFFYLACDFVNVQILFKKSIVFTARLSNSILFASNLAASSKLFIKLSSISPQTFPFNKISSASGERFYFSMNSILPSTELSGLRKSCETDAKNISRY